VDPRIIFTAAEPFHSFFAVPQRIDKLPAGAAISGTEQSTGNGPGPQQVRFIQATDFQ
jgi:hypothetical protein